MDLCNRVSRNYVVARRADVGNFFLSRPVEAGLYCVSAEGANGCASAGNRTGTPVTGAHPSKASVDALQQKQPGAGWGRRPRAAEQEQRGMQTRNRSRCAVRQEPEGVGNQRVRETGPTGLPSCQSSEIHPRCISTNRLVRARPRRRRCSRGARERGHHRPVSLRAGANRRFAVDGMIGRRSDSNVRVHARHTRDACARSAYRHRP